MRSYEATGRGFGDGVHKYASGSLVLVSQEMLVSSFVQEVDKCFLGGGSYGSRVKSAGFVAVPNYWPKRFFISNSSYHRVHLDTFVLDFFYHDVTLKVCQYDWMHQFSLLFHQTRLMGLL